MEITYEQYKEACLTIKNYRTQEQKKRLSTELGNIKTNVNPSCEDVREIYSYRLYYQILTYFGKSPGYHRLEPSIMVSDLNNASKAKFYRQKGFGKRLEWQLDSLCKKYKITLAD